MLATLTAVVVLVIASFSDLSVVVVAVASFTLRAIAMHALEAEADSASGVVTGDVGDDEITLTSFIDLPDSTSSAYGGFGDDRITANGVTSMSLIDGGFGDDTITTSGIAAVSVLNGGFGRDAITAACGVTPQPQKTGTSPGLIVTTPPPR